MKCDTCQLDLDRAGHYAKPKLNPDGETWGECAVLGDIYKCENKDCLEHRKNVYVGLDGVVFKSMKG